MSTLLLTLAWIAPLLLAAAGFMRRGLWLPVVAALPAFIAALSLPDGATVDIPWLLLGVTLGLDETSRVFLLFTSILWLAAGGYAALQMRQDRQGGRFRLFFLLAMAGNFWLILGQDLVSFYLGFGLMGLAAYGLVVHDGSEEARRAGRIYLVMTLIAEVALFFGLMLMYQRVGDLTPSAAAIAGAGPLELFALSLAFATKAGLFGVHVWLPLAHPAAPVAASAVLSGAMIKAALVGWLRYLPLGTLALPELGVTMTLLGAATMLFAIGVGLVQTEPKATLAYSSVGKMGMMAAVVGVIALQPGLAPALVPALALYAAHHGLSKGTLFLGVGAAKTLHAAWVPVLLVLPALALAGAPLTSGAAVKALVKDGLVGVDVVWVELLGWLLLISAVGSTLLMARFLTLVRSLTDSAEVTQTSGSVRAFAPWFALLALVLLFPFTVAQPSLDGALPVLTGILIAGVVWRLRPRLLTSLTGGFPPGDLVVPIERLWARIAPLTRMSHRVAR